MRKKEIYKINELTIIAHRFIEYMSGFTTMSKALVVGLYGELGAGKTAFTKEVARTLGVVEHVVSPTFVIERIYHIPSPPAPVLGSTKLGLGKLAFPFDHLIHIDAYRLESEDELLHLGWKDILAEPRNLIFVEWADRVEKILPQDHIQIHFEHIDEITREIKIK